MSKCLLRASYIYLFASPVRKSLVTRASQKKKKRIYKTFAEAEPSQSLIFMLTPSAHRADRGTVCESCHTPWPESTWRHQEMGWALLLKRANSRRGISMLLSTTHLPGGADIAPSRYKGSDFQRLEAVRGKKSCDDRREQWIWKIRWYGGCGQTGFKT